MDKSSDSNPLTPAAAEKEGPFQSPSESKHTLTDKLREWSRLFLTVGGMQILIQGIGFLAGIVIIRRIAPREYALYTLANTMLGTMNLLADGGISFGVMAEGGQVWRDRGKLGLTISTGIALRRRFAAVSVAISAPTLLYLFRNHGASWPTALAMIPVVVGTFWCYLLGSIFSVAPNLHQRVAQTQRIGLVQSFGRLGGLGVLLPVFPRAITAMVAGLLAQVWAVFRVRRLSDELIDSHQPESNEIRLRVLKVVRRMLPDLVYFTLSSQITIWLISIFGTTLALAQVGALSRLGQITTIISAFLASVIVPRYARLRAGRDIILLRYFQVLLLMAVIGVCMVTIVALFPRQVLWILGPQYSNLTHEVVLLAAGSAIGLPSGAAYHLACARGCVIHPVVGIGLQAAWQVFWVLRLNLSSVRGVLSLTIITLAFQLVIHAANMVIQARRLPATASEAC